jgi:hypothetical protein
MYLSSRLGHHSGGAAANSIHRCFFFYEGSLVPKRATYLAEQSQDGVVPVPQEDALEFIE